MNMLETDMCATSDSLYNIVRLAAVFGGDSTKDLNQYTEMVEKLCVIDSQMNNHRKAMEDSSRETTIEGFDHSYKTKLEKKKPNLRSHKRYKEFVQYAKPLLNPSLDGQTTDQNQNDGDELMIEDDIPNMIDPITKRPLEVPVRNKQCNHVYEKTTMEQLLKRNPRTRCPIMGCAAQGYVQLKLLEVDVKLQRQLMRARSALL
ncbi:E3 SUMO-protein ligase NSE2-like [Anopheles maculipalpis]|uniref:E3 SUMO-protein ligase NSE2-like n=1 Tax=Anopheles maculipalpis TaxID=1496333 RepID=UPI002159874E|nr:E3 SUMO-protein ligase NSE2-like [Anopheles maculipalpis]